MYLIAIGWLYVALMMAVVEATSSVGSVLGAFFTFLLYGVGPVALVLYLMGHPGRRRARLAREAQLPGTAAAVAPSAHQPDSSSKAPADPVAPVRKEA